jgi:hypothetical protein
LQKEFGERGLTIVGVTSEPQKKTEEFIEETRAEYAYAYDSSGDLMRALGARGYPSAALVDPSGTVVWTGHPASLDSGIVAKYLDGAFKTPVWEWPKSTSAVVKALKKNQFADVLAKLDKLAGTDDGIADIRASVEGMIASRMAVLEQAYTDGDFHGALAMAEAAKKDMRGLDSQATRAAELLDTIKKDKEAKRVIKLQEELLALREERLNTKKDVEELIVAVEKLREEASGTYAATQAAEYVVELRGMLD